MAPVDKENSAPNAARDILWVPAKAFDIVKSKLAKGTAVSKEDVNELVNPTLKNDDSCIPVDMNGAGENLDDFEAALERLGAKRAGECFLKAFEHFESTKSSIPAAERPEPITGRQYKKKYYDDDGDDEDDTPVRYLPDLFHIPKSVFLAIKSKLSKKQAIDKTEVDGLVNWEPQDSETYLPIDMHGADEDLDDFEEALAKLGPEVTARCFVQAFDRFQKKKHLLPADKQKDLTCKEWKEAYGNQDQDQEGEEEEEKENDDEDDEEEERLAEEEEDEADGEDDGEPPSKKPKL